MNGTRIDWSEGLDDPESCPNAGCPEKPYVDGRIVRCPSCGPVDLLEAA